MKEKRLNILIGLPGSGKTTFLKGKIGTIFSSDNIRKELLNNEEDQSDNKLVFDTLKERLVNEIEEGTRKDIFIDATSLSKKERNFYTHGLKGRAKKKSINLEIIAIDFKTSISTCIERDKKRERVVGEDIISRMSMRYCKPTIKEGFDKIITIEENKSIDLYFNKVLLNYIIDVMNVANNIKLVSNDLNDSRNKELKNNIERVLSDSGKNFLIKQLGVKQKSKYHQESLFEHLTMILILIVRKYQNKEISLLELRILSLLTIFHDIGKIYSASIRKDNIEREGWVQDLENPTLFKKNGREKIVENYNDIQFIGHEKISGYIFERDIKEHLIGLMTEEEIRLIELIIYNHLNYHNHQKKDINNKNESEKKLLIEESDYIEYIGNLFSEVDSKGRKKRED